MQSLMYRCSWRGSSRWWDGADSSRACGDEWKLDRRQLFGNSFVLAIFTQGRKHLRCLQGRGFATDIVKEIERGRMGQIFGGGLEMEL